MWRWIGGKYEGIPLLLDLCERISFLTCWCHWSTLRWHWSEPGYWAWSLDVLKKASWNWILVAARCSKTGVKATVTPIKVGNQPDPDPFVVRHYGFARRISRRKGLLQQIADCGPRCLQPSRAASGTMRPRWNKGTGSHDVTRNLCCHDTNMQSV